MKKFKKLTAILLSMVMLLGTVPVNALVGTASNPDVPIDVPADTEPSYVIAVFTTTTQFYATAARVAQETESVYFAISRDGGKNFEVLN